MSETMDFSGYNGLTLANVKLDCERFYQCRPGFCDVLYSDRGPSCTSVYQVTGKKVLLVRFLENKRAPTPKTSNFSIPTGSESSLPTSG